MDKLGAGQAQRLRARDCLGWDFPAGDVNLMTVFGAFVGHYFQQWKNPLRLVLVVPGRVVIL